MFPTIVSKRDKLVLGQCIHIKEQVHEFFGVTRQQDVLRHSLQQWHIPPIGDKAKHKSLRVTLVPYLVLAATLQQPLRHAEHKVYKIKARLIRFSIKFWLVALKHCVGTFTRYTAPVIWVLGKLYLFECQKSHKHEEWISRLAAQGTTLATYTPTLVQHSCCVYLLLGIDSSHSYIGATHKSLPGRHMTRVRTLKVLSKTSLVQCEAAIRFWHSTRSFHKFLPIVFAATDSRLSALALESALQAQFQPSLCMPWIVQHFKTSGKSVMVKSLTIGQKLYARFRKRKHSFMTDQEKTVTHQTAIKQLYNLGSFSVQRFRTSRLLRRRNGVEDHLHLYYLYRQCRHLDMPYQGRAYKALKSILAVHDLPLPHQPRPLIMAFLAHAEYKTRIKSLLKQFILRYQEHWAPFHWPSTTIVEGKHVTIADCLHNWKRSMREWTWNPPKECRCHEVLRKYPDLPKNTDGHIAGGLQSSHLPHHLNFLSNTCTKDGCFLSKARYESYGAQQLKQWLRQEVHSHLLSILQQEWQELLAEQWKQHHDTVTAERRFTVKDVCTVKALLPSVIFHNEDHHPNKLCVYCPLRYHALLLKTFQDTAVFSPVKWTPVQYRVHQLSQCSKRIRKRYAWGIKLNCQIPSAYILPKGKKQFTNARPIIASAKTTCAVLFAALGKLLADILPIAYPHTYGHRTMKQILQCLHQFLETVDRSEDLSNLHDFKNEDLKGFFTSVPHDMIMKAATHLIVQYLKTHPSHGDPMKLQFTVKIGGKSKERTIRGKSFSTVARHKTIFLTDIPELIRLALDMSVFGCMGTLYKQSRGAIIGGHASPAICSMTVAFHEQVWLQSFKITTASRMLCIRYVDNRLVIIPKELMQDVAYQMFTDLLFYEAPVELENCGDNVLLGYEISLHDRTCLYKVPQQSYFYRSPRSAGSTERILSGLGARLHLLYRGTYPKQRCAELLRQLLQGYQDQGFSISELRKISFKVSAQYIRGSPN